MEKERYLSGAYEPRTSEEMRQYYDRWAEVYDVELTENAYQQPRRCAEALTRSLSDRRNARILDAGCGTGLSGLALVEAGFQHIDGCDFSKQMLEKAFETGIYSKLFVTDLNRPPLDTPTATYDAVTAVGIFSFGHVGPDALDEFVRVVKPGGLIVIGLNEKYFEEGSIARKLGALGQNGVLEEIAREHGDHIPGTGLSGWVIVARKALPDGADGPAA
jgi:predicted TPR repeat methyltransferase